MRIVVFTSLPEFPETLWLRAIGEADTVGSVLVVIHRPRSSPRVRKLLENVRTYGWRYVTWRISHGRVQNTLSPRAHHVTALKPHVQLLETDDLNGPWARTMLEQFAPDLGISIGAPLLTVATYALPRIGTVNVHLGDSSAFRGSAPGFWELFTNASQIGATLHFIDDGIDTGPVIARLTEPLADGVSLRQAEQLAVRLGLALLRKYLPLVLSGAVVAKSQTQRGVLRKGPTVGQHMELCRRRAKSPLAAFLRLDV